MAAPKENADYVLSIRLPKSTMDGLVKLAARESRSTANFIRLTLKSVVDQRGTDPVKAVPVKS